YLRGMAEEFGESTNAIRHELNNLSRASYLTAAEDGRTIRYRANIDHPLYPEIKNLVHKYLGLDKIVDHILSKLGRLYYAFVVGDYACGRDSGVIELVLIGDIDVKYLGRLIRKVEKLINRRIEASVMSLHDFRSQEDQFAGANTLVMWSEK